MITTFNDALQIIQNCKGITEAQLMARKAEIRHLDGNPQNNNVENLAYGSASENIQDMYRYRGAVRAGQKLTPAVAEDIRMGIASDAPNKTLAETYGVSQQTICDIKHKRIYAGGNV